MQFSVSTTSRAQRGQEIDGSDYHSLTLKEFKEQSNTGDLIEWEEVYPNQFYGTLKSELNHIWKSGKHVIFDVDVVGGLNLKKYFGTRALSIFVQPPNEIELEKRLRGRGTETEEKIQMRLSKAKKELEFAKDFDVILLNEHLDQAFREAQNLVTDFINK